MKNLRWLVLSFGRAGSVYLANLIGLKENSEITFIKSYQQLLTNAKKVSHSHLFFFDRVSLRGVQRVFILRHDPLQTILSHYLSIYHKKYHNFSNAFIAVDKIEVTDYNLINTLCENYIEYHSNYSFNMLDDDLVIFYEDLVSRVAENQVLSFPVYHNKQDLITNYNQVIDYLVDNYEHELKLSQVRFEQHINMYDIYDVLEIRVRNE